MASIFKKRILKDRLDQFSIPNMEAKLAIVQKWHQAYKDGHLEKKGEKEAEQEFIQQIFVEVLEHTRFPDNPYTIIPQGKTMTSGQKPDAILGYFENDKEPEKLAAVCEIKDCNTPLDRSQKREGNLSPIQQAFKYKTQYQSCDFVIATNFIEIRLLKDNELNFEKWTLDCLVDPTNDYFEFKKFYYLLCRKNLIASRGKSVTLQLLSDIQVEQEAITKEFYKLYKELRQKLIVNIWKNNEEAKKKSRFYELAVEKAQKIIDRIVFVAFCEDLGLLPENILQKVVESDNQTFGSTWDTLKGFFKAVDVGSPKLGNTDGYNGELFKPDEDLDKLVIDDEICHEFLKIGLYDFSEDLSVNILGHIFEQSISDLEDLKKVGEGTDQENTTSKRKKDGIFYTPEYIVDYIVQNSVGAWLKEQEEKILGKHNVKEELEDKNYKKRYREAYEEYQIILQNIKVLDPACGSGAFLVKVFDFLLEENKRVVDILAEARGGAITFDDTEKTFKEILQNNIYGVDLNTESVEITKLSLWLKTAQKGKKLTTLKNNIKCGNSLIDDPTVAGDRAFKWNDEFKEIMSKGGFDVVVGNPPYVQLSKLEATTTIEKNYLINSFKTSGGRLNTFIFFIHLAERLLQKHGHFGYIIPNTILTQEYYKDTRELLFTKGHIRQIITYENLQFTDAVVETVSLLFQKDREGSVIEIIIQKPETITKLKTIPLKCLSKGNGYAIAINEDEICKKIEDLRFSTLSKNFDINQAIALKGDKTLSVRNTQESGYFKLIDGKNINRYSINWSGDYLDYDIDRIHSCKRKDIFLKEKVLFRRVSSDLICTYDEEGYFALNTLVVVTKKSELESTKLKYILAILNSKLINYFYKRKYKSTKKVFSEIQARTVGQIPIATADSSTQTKIIEKVDSILELSKAVKKQTNKFETLITQSFSVEKWPKNTPFWMIEFKTFLNKLNLSKIPLIQKDDLLQLWNKYVPELQELDSKIKQLDQEIDAIVFDLYELTPEERQIVLESTAT